jgi:hypothetical protein
MQERKWPEHTTETGKDAMGLMGNKRESRNLNGSSETNTLAS